jgi:4-carboxymuconolactone decarboxylase
MVAGGRRPMGQTVRFQETLRRQAMIDEGFVENEARLGLAAASALDPVTTALLHVGVPVAIGSPAVCLEWSAGRALAAGASEDEIAGVLLAIASVAGLGRVVAADPEVAIALEKYADQNDRDYAALQAAVKDRRAEAATDI